MVILVDPRKKKITTAAEGRMPNGGSMAELQVLHRHVDLQQVYLHRLELLWLDAYGGAVTVV